METYDPTIEDLYRKQVVIDGQSCMLEVLDTAGQEEYTALRDQWMRDGEGFILVYSITSRASFNRIRRFYSQIQRVKETPTTNTSTSGQSGFLPAASTLKPSLGPTPIMLVGNKADRITEREVSTQEGTALAKEMECQYVEASAKNCINVEKAFYDVVRTLSEQRREKPAQTRGSFPFVSKVTSANGMQDGRADTVGNVAGHGKSNGPSKEGHRYGPLSALRKRNKQCTLM